jgi:prolyl 4-hydroxylase
MYASLIRTCTAHHARSECGCSYLVLLRSISRSILRWFNEFNRPNLPTRTGIEADYIMSSHLWTVDHVFEPETCRAYIEAAERGGWNRTGIAEGYEPTRYTKDASIDTDQLFFRLAPTMPPARGSRTLLHVPRERVSCMRYDVGDSFAAHTDAAYLPSSHVGSEYSIVIYLNDGFSGGETYFPDFDVTVFPKVGTALIFEHKITHLARPVISGRKYILHAFVMYGSQSRFSSETTS